MNPPVGNLLIVHQNEEQVEQDYQATQQTNGKIDGACKELPCPQHQTLCHIDEIAMLYQSRQRIVVGIVQQHATQTAKEFGRRKGVVEIYGN